VATAYDDIVEKLEADNPTGRLILLRGEPGTGKTYMIRGLLKDVDSLFIYVPPNMLSQLISPSFLPVLINAQKNNKTLILILEDADEALKSRDDNMTLISTILNLTSGIIADLLDLRIVATTNSEIKKLDDAVKREGRLAKYVHVQKLEAEQANNAYMRLTDSEEKPFSNPKTLAQVYIKATNKKDGASKESEARFVGDVESPTRKIGFGS